MRRAAHVHNESMSIKLLVLDVDGTLTDGRTWYSRAGEAMLAFDKRDGHGIMLAKQHGIEVIWLTAHLTEPTAARAHALQCEVIEAKDKAKALKKIMRAKKLLKYDVVYVGDDLPDLACIDMVQDFYAPNDHVLPCGARLITLERNGGHGAAREAIDIILAERNAQ